jgi:hypothetical protein
MFYTDIDLKSGQCLGGFKMGKRVYRVKKGDDFFKISRKLYGNASYAMDLMRANPGFNWLGKGMVLRLPKMDPRLTRQRKIKRRMKDYVPPEEPEEQIDWWDDPAFEEEMADVFAETALSIGLDENVLRDELGLGEGTPLLKEASSKNWTQSRTEKGNLHSSRTSPDREGQSQTNESSQTATGSTTPPITLTDEQIDALKDNLEKLGLDVDVAMAELGLGEGATASTTATQPTDTGVDGGDDGKDGPGGKVARPAEPEGPTQTEAPPPTGYRDVETQEELDAWYEKAYEKASSARAKGWINLMYIKKKRILEGKATQTPTPQPTLTAEEQKRADIEAEYETIIMPEEGPYIPENHILDYSGFGEGYNPNGPYGSVYWDQFRYQHASKPNVAQNMSPDLLVSEEVQSKVGDLKTAYNANLCGQLAVIAALGFDLKEAMGIFARLDLRGYDEEFNYNNEVSNGYEILQEDITTSYLTLMDYIDVLSDGKFKTELRRKGKDPLNTPEKFAEQINSGNVVIACVTIDTSKEGQLMDMESSSTDTAHWVWVQEIIPTKEDDNPLVRVYNPYMNREEIYDWETFSGAHEATSNNSDFLSIVASSSEP